MLYLELEIPVKGIHQAFIPGKGLKGNGIDKVRGIPGHQHMNVRVLLLQRTCKICDLICGNTACHSQKNGLSL